MQLLENVAHMSFGILQQWKVALPSQIVPWPREGVRRASINSVSIGQHAVTAVELRADVHLK